MLKNRSGLVYLAGIFLFLILHHLYAYQGHFGYDDIWYARLAKQVADGNFSVTNDHYTYRWVTIFFTALAYKMLGVSDRASALMPILATFFTAALIYTLARKKGERIAILAMILYALHYWTFYYSDKIMPDVYVAASVFVVTAALHYHRFIARGKNAWWYAAIFSAALFTGFLAKETMLFAAPLVLVVMLSDLVQKRYSNFWICCAAFTVLLFGGYSTWIYLKTGDILSRVYAISAGSYLNPCSYDLLPVSVLIKRVAYELWLVFIRSGLAIGILFLIPNLRAGLKNLAAMKDETAFWTTLSCVGLLAANFMSTSYKSYVPMCPDPRHFLFLVPIIAMAAAPVADEYIATGKYALYVLAATITLFVISWMNGYEFTFYTAFPLFVIATFRYLGKRFFPERTAIFYFLFLVILVTPALFAYQYSKKNNYFTQKQVVESFFGQRKEKNLVITDEVEQHLAEYHLKFDTSSTRFISFEKARSFDFAGYDSIYVLSNGYTRYLSNLDYNTLPEYVKHQPVSSVKLFDYNDVILYKLSADEVLMRK